MKATESIADRAKRILRYSIRVEIEAGMEMGSALEEVIEWLSSDECEEMYELQNGVAQNGEVFSEVVAEVAKEYTNQ